MSNDEIGGFGENNPGRGDASNEHSAGVARGSAAVTGPARLQAPLESAVVSASAAAAAALAEINRLLAGHTGRTEEERILDILRSAAKTDLNYVLANLNLRETIGDIDNRSIGPDNKDALYRLLSRDRLPDISIRNRATLITAVQLGTTDSSAERFVRDILVGTKGAELTALKCAIDDGGDVYDLHKLLFDDIDDGGIRNEIVAHFQREGATAPTGQVKVLSDIDDTFFSNLKDTRYPKGTVYPGVRAFYEELDKGAGAMPNRLGDLAFLTARPEDEAHVIESATLRMLKEKGVTRATILGGDFGHALGNENIAAGKFAKFEEFKSLYPEYGFVFTGDSGQGDAIFAEKMMTKYPGAAKAAFIHDVVNTSQEKRGEMAQKSVIFFDTYVGAAVEALGKGLVAKTGLARVGRASVEEFKTMRFASDEQKAARLGELRKDINLANAKLPVELKVSLPA